MKGDYANGRIYKIEPICEHDENEVYYGSTCQILCKRMDTHRSGYTSWKAGKRGKTRSFDLLDKYTGKVSDPESLLLYVGFHIPG